VLRWCVSNVTVETDHAENLKPSKKKSTERIDGISALVNALPVALPTTTGSVYDSRTPLLVKL
jgi:phage terminase large subunit-like protein